MPKKKETYGPPQRMWLSTYKRLRKMLRRRQTMTELLDELSRSKRGVPVRGSID